MSSTSKEFDLVGVGIGPANLSLAALLSGCAGLTTTFLDRKKSFEWHAGIMVPDATMQVHFLKDLVTPVDPTNPFSFLAFAVEAKRLYRLIVADRTQIPRKEFEQYCRWAADRMENLRFGISVADIEWDGRAFVVQTDDGPIRARNIVSGTGLEPWLPGYTAGHDPNRVFHSANLLTSSADLSRSRVAVVGGGQSGAEVVHHLLSSDHQRPPALLWGTRRNNLLPLDDSPFVEELFLPNYSHHFHGLPADRRRQLNEQQRMASDGVSMGLLKMIYRRLYDLELLHGVERPCRVMVDHELVAIDERPDGLLTTWRSGSGETVRHLVDLVVCATGYRHTVPQILGGLRGRLRTDDAQRAVRADFSLDWDGPAGNRIYVQNAAREEFGVADPNLSLVAWRSAVIANSLLGRDRFDTGAVSAAIDWAGPRSEHLPADRREERRVPRGAR
jgi:lysine N6-hydroxylase